MAIAAFVLGIVSLVILISHCIWHDEEMRHKD